MAGLLISQQLAEPPATTFWQIAYALFMFGLVVFLAIIVTRLWAKRRAGIVTGPRQHLRLLEHLPLGTGKGLCLVKVLDAVLLVSVTDEAITVLQEFPMSPEFELPSHTTNTLTLPAWLAKILPWGKATDSANQQAAQQPVQPDSGFAHELQERLRRLQEPKL